MQVVCLYMKAANVAGFDPAELTSRGSEPLLRVAQQKRKRLAIGILDIVGNYQ